MMWLRDMAAGAGLLIFIVFSFALANGAQALLTAL